MGFVDRGGGREAKGTSLRRSKKNPGAPTTKNKSAHKNFITPTTRDTPTPPAACVPFIKTLAEAGADAPTTTSVVQQVLEQGTTKAQALHIDAAVALLSRKLEDDQEGIFRRAVEEGNLAGAVCWSNEVEKQAALLDTCVQHNKLLRGAAADAPATNAPSSSSTAATTRHVRFHEDVLAPSPVAVTTGAPPPSAKTGVILYAVLGVHVNSVDRVNMRLHDQWIKELEENVKHGDVVGVLSGLNLSRDHGTHYAQERLLRECWRVAAAAGLPLVLHLYAADAVALTDTVNRTAELISELLASATAAATTTTESTKEGRGNNNSNNNTNNNNAATTAAGAMPSAVVLYNGLTALHASPAMQQLVRTHRPSASTSVPFYVLVTAEGLVERRAADEDVADGRTGTSASVADVAALLPSRRIHNVNATIATASTTAVVQLSQLLIGTGAPWGTPQNLPDAYLSTLPNEPGNYPYVVKTVFDAMPTGPPSEGDDSKDEAAVASAEELAAHVFLNQLRVFFHECIAAAEDEKEETANTHNMNYNNNSNNNDGVEGEEAPEHDAATCEDDAARQRAWAESQQPAAATAVAGLHDSAAKRDLEALLAEAAKERERVEQERQREEAERENARNEELLEKRSKREKKKHVKANNRSNFSHFRNKDFAPRQTKQERLAALQHQHELGAGSEDDDEENKEPEHHDGSSSSDDDSDVEHGDAEASKERVAAGRAARGKGKNTRRDTSSGSSSSSSSDNDDGVNGEGDENNRHGGSSSSNAANSLAAEVELLLKEAEEEKHGRAGQKSGKKNNKKNVKAAAANATATPPPPPPPSASATQKPLKGRKGKGPKARLDSESSDKEENGSGQDDAAMAMNPASRRQRKRQQKRQQQQQHKGDDSDDE